MSRGRARLAFFDHWTDPVAETMLDGRDELELVRCELAAEPEQNWHRLATVHGYQALIRTEAMTRPAIGPAFLPGAALVARCPDLLAVCTAGAGYDIVDVDACTSAGVIVCNNSGPGAEAVAEHALGFMLALAKKIGLADRAIRRAAITDRSSFTNTELRGKTLGVVGLGRIGTRLVELCAPFAMRVLAYDPYVGTADASARGADLTSFETLLAESDFVVAMCPLTDATEGLFDRAAFGRMKPTAYFVTTARGRVHDENSLVDALMSGAIAGAGIDVFDTEPPPPSHPLLALDTVIATPHTAGVTHEARRDLAVAGAEQWLTIFGAGAPGGLVNSDVWPRYSDRFERLLGRRPAPLRSPRTAAADPPS
jgi:D-3-phosphoglycerate dehydrogenase / 2-oxoglutarate reductase